MANQVLIKYIREQIQAGYDVNTIKSHLVNHGYVPGDVDFAINEIYHPQVSHHVHHISKGATITIAIIGLLIALMIPTVYFYMSGGSPAQLLDVRTEALVEDIIPGDRLEFNIELSNQGRSKRYDVFLRHEVVDTDIYVEETIAVETFTSKKTFVQIPGDIPSKRYNLKTTATYEDKKAFSTFGFNVVDEGEEKIKCSESWHCTAWTPSSCPESGEQTRTCTDSNNCGTRVYKPITTQTCTNIQKQQQPISDVPVESDEFSGLTIWEKLDIIKSTASSNPSKAKEECAALEIESHRDECYYNVAEITLSTSDCNYIISDRTKDKCLNNIAKTSTDSSQCELIEKESRRDSCYMNFVNNGDYTVCDKIVNTYLKDACEALRDMPDIVVA